MVEALEDQWQQARLLEALAPRVPEDFFEQFWQTISDLNYRTKQVQILKALLPHLSTERLAALFHTIQAWPDARERTELLETLLPSLPAEQSASLPGSLLPSQPEQAHPAGQAAWSDGEQVKRLVALLPRLPEGELRVVLPELLQLARRQRQESEQARILTTLAPRIPQEMLPDVMGLLWSFESGQRQEEVLAALLPGLSSQGWARLIELTMAKALAGGDARAPARRQPALFRPARPAPSARPVYAPGRPHPFSAAGARASRSWLNAFVLTLVAPMNWS